jgi:hypothetical protein
MPVLMFARHSADGAYRTIICQTDPRIPAPFSYEREEKGVSDGGAIITKFSVNRLFRRDERTEVLSDDRP